MAVNLKITLGTVNYTDWLHVTASKVPSPSVIVWEDWIDVPASNYNFIIPGLDPEDYYIRYYDAATDSALGTLVAELLANAMTNEFQYERRFYTVGGAGTYDPADGDTSITDPYLIGKNITGVFKEGFRYFDPEDEYTFDDSTGEVAIVNGTQLSNLERVIVEIKYATGTISASSGGIYSGTLNITEATKTLLASDRNKRCRLVGTDSTQYIKLCALASISVDDGFYFDNSVGGSAIQPVITFETGDQLRYNGFMIASNLFDQIWVSRGEHLLIRKYDDDYWEIITDYKGTNVGERIAAGYKAHPNTLTENGQLVDGDEYPRLWWWINNVLPSTHRYTDNTVTSGGWAPTSGKEGQFAVHGSLKKFRMPKTCGYVEKGLADFETYGSDTANRPVDYPGGSQDEMLLAHGHRVNTGGDTPPADPGKSLIRQSYNGDGYASSGTGASSQGPYIEVTGGVQNRVDNIGVVYLRRI